MRVHLADALFPSRWKKPHRSPLYPKYGRLVATGFFNAPPLFFFPLFPFKYIPKERERERERERKRACRAPIKRSTLFFIPPSTLPRPLIPSFPFTFLFFKPSPLPSLSIPLRRSSFYILYVYLRPLFYSTFYFLSRFYPLIAVLSIPLFASTSLSSRFLFPHSSIIFLPPYAPLPHPPASLSLSLSLSLLAGSFSSVSIPLSSCPSLFTSRVLSLLRFFVLSPATHYYFSHGSLRVPLLERPINFAAILRLALSQSWAPSTFLAALPASASPRLPARVVSRRACKYASVFLRVTRAYIRVHVYTCIRTGACAMHVVPNLHRAFNIGRLRHNFPAGTQSWPTGTRGSLRFIPCTDTRISAEICTKNAAWRGHNSPTWRWFYIRRKIDGADDYRRPISRPFIPRVVAPRVFSTPPSLTRHSPSLFLFSFLVAYFSFFFFYRHTFLHDALDFSFQRKSFRCREY